jgi:hypothetical protein
LENVGLQGFESACEFIGIWELSAASSVTTTCITRPCNGRSRGIHMKTQTKVAAARTTELSISPAKLRLAGAAFILALFAAPHIGHAQGIVGGAEQGYREGGRAAGPVGAVVGGAVGAGVGGAIGAVDGVLGIPNAGYRRGYRCRGFYDRYRRFHCYR